MGIQINGQTDRISAVDGSFGIQDLAELNISGIVTAASANFTGNVSIGGTLTYQDVTNIDSVGIITARAGVKVPDSQKIFVGTGDDLEIYHDGSNSYLHDAGTGGVIVRSSRFRVNNAANTENIIRADENGAVYLYYDNSQKFITKSDGVDITGELQCDTLDVDGNIDLDGGKITFDSGGNVLKWADSVAAYFGDGSDLRIYHDGSNSWITENGTGSLKIRSTSGQVQILGTTSNENMAVFTVDGSAEFYYDNVKKFETHADGLHIGDGGNLDMPHDSSKIVMGASDDLEIYHDGSHSYVKDNGTGNLKIVSNGTAVQIEKSDGENMAIFRTDSSVDLYYDNTKRFETRSTGVRVTGRIEINGSNGRIEYNNIANTFEFFTGGNKVAEFLSGGHFVPGTNNTYDLGSSSYRWRNIYTNDLNLSNEGSTNDVDGTWGNYTIQEGENDLYLINRRNGKKYKFNLTEVN